MYTHTHAEWHAESVCVCVCVRACNNKFSMHLMSSKQSPASNPQPPTRQGLSVPQKCRQSQSQSQSPSTAFSATHFGTRPHPDTKAGRLLHSFRRRPTHYAYARLPGMAPKLLLQVQVQWQRQQLRLRQRLRLHLKMQLHLRVSCAIS